MFKSLYLETGCMPLSERQRVAKLGVKIRKIEDYTIPKCRLVLFKKMLVPDIKKIVQSETTLKKAYYTSL